MKNLNTETVLVILLLILLIFRAIRSLVRKKKKGGHVSCGGDCSACPSAQFCTKEEKQSR